MYQALCAFADELSKIAAWTPKDAKELKVHLRQQGKFEQMSAKGMTDTQKKLHLDNTARIQEFLKKKRGDVRTVPRWARKPGGKPPEAHYRPPPSPGRRAPGFSPKMLRKLKIIGGVAGGLTAANLGAAAYTDYKRWKERKAGRMRRPPKAV